MCGADNIEEAKRLYQQGDYDDYEHDFDNFQDYEFVEIEEVKSIIEQND